MKVSGGLMLSMSSDVVVHLALEPRTYVNRLMA